MDTVAVHNEVWPVINATNAHRNLGNAKILFKFIPVIPNSLFLILQLITFTRFIKKPTHLWLDEQLYYLWKFIGCCPIKYANERKILAIILQIINGTNLLSITQRIY